MNTTPLQTPTPTSAPTPEPTPIQPQTPMSAQAPEPDREVNNFATQRKYLMTHHKVGFLITFIGSIVVAILIVLPSLNLGALFIGFMIFIALNGIWFGIARKQIEHQIYADFAAEKGYTFIPKPAPFPLPIPLMTMGHSHHTFDYMTGTYPNSVPFNIFSHMLTVGSGKSSRTYVFTVTSLVLPGVAPHLYLEAPSFYNYDTREMMRRTFRTFKQYSLEGDFDKHYKLFGEGNDQIDLLQLIEPAAMQKLMQVRGCSIVLNQNVLTYIQRGQCNSGQGIQNMLDVGPYLLDALGKTIKEMNTAATLEAAAPQSQPVQ